MHSAEMLLAPNFLNEEKGKAFATLSKSATKPHLQLISNTKPTVWFGIDIDDTLYSFENIAREAFLKLYEDTGDKAYLKGAYNSWVEWRSPADACGVDTWLQVIDMCHQSSVISEQIPFKDAARTVNEIADAGYGILYISNRSPDTKSVTLDWLVSNGFPYSNGRAEVHCITEDKSSILSRCQYIIDDRPRTLVKFVEGAKSIDIAERWGLGLLYAHNRALTDIPKIFLSPTWAGIRSWLNRKEVLPS